MCQKKKNSILIINQYVVSLKNYPSDIRDFGWANQK